ncbi:N-acetyl-gamma-glutamyl-phosphate reductase [Pelagirhabdus alkalitolerans]|uniref:N-acetyl-gamma-glutamyl-phosphate reductase n=1 Tax=Pelagirhabdus alkalitolerans TaxID=1612202 RepID=A0A1G6GKB2_9BACI|nr:N-acetyl-gamma-glutamyl-phosphate reductase [Pelagirhabdus alkalitolerans]SDB82438.1 N-acetyl-gamma-glutamyl-phosphate reductase [Pelagirhabdus alkalitolerans]
MDVAIVGGSGYGGVELIRFLYHHPHVDQIKVVSHSKANERFSDIYPHMKDHVDLTMESMSVEAISQYVDVVFFATPANVSSKWMPELIKSGVKCIDLSGDFRLKDQEVYEEWYGYDAADAETLKEAVYGLTEENREAVKQAQLIANPGCYPTATLLGLMPAVHHKLIDLNSIIIDGKTGASGAGRSLSQNVHYSEMNENTKAYKLGAHKHIPEIEQWLSKTASEEVTVQFTPHIVPMTRGIMTTIYGNLSTDYSQQKMNDLYQDYYKNDPFVKVYTNNHYPQTKEVYGSNYCAIAVHVDERTNKLTVISVIDNLVKGASGQAIQNFNIMHGFDEKTGLELLPIFP